MLPLGKIGVRTIQKSLKEDEIIRQIIKLIEQRPNPDVQFSALIDCHDVCLRQVLWSLFFFFIWRHVALVDIFEKMINIDVKNQKDQKR